MKAVNKNLDVAKKLENKDINELFDSLDTNQDNVLDDDEFCGYDGQKRNFIINGGLQGNTIYNWVVVNTPGPQVVRAPLVRIPLMRIIKMSAFI